MVVINLLPWRAKWQRYQVMITCCCLAGALLLALFIGGLSCLYVSRHIETLDQQLLSLQATEKQLAHKKPLAVPSLITRVEVLPSEVHWMREQAAIGWTALMFDYAEHVCFTAFSQHKHTLTFTGESRSVTDLTEFLLHWQGAQQGETVEVDQVQRLKSGKTHFRFHVEAIV